MWIFGYGSLVWKADFPYIKKIVGFVEGYERKFWQASVDHRGVPGKPGRVVTLVPSPDSNARVWGTAFKIHPDDIEYVIRHLDLREITGYERVPEDFHPIPNHPLNWDIGLETRSVSESKLTSGSISMEKLDQGYWSGDSSESGDSAALNASFDFDDQLESESEEEPTPPIESFKFGTPFRVTMYFGSETNEYFMGPAPLEEMAATIFQCSGHSGENREYLFNLAHSMREICEEALDSHLSDLEKAVKELEVREMEIQAKAATAL
jgi:cation transport regulator ChaC